MTKYRAILSEMTFKLRDHQVIKLICSQNRERGLAGGWLKGVDMLLNVSIVVLTANFIAVTQLKKEGGLPKKTIVVC